MNPELIKFIELCLIDGTLSEKEKQVIFRKAEQLGVPKDECEIILDGMLFNSNARKEQEIELDDQDLDIHAIATMDKPFLENIITYLNELNQEFESVISEQGANALFQEWYGTFSSNLVQDSEMYLGNIKYNLFFKEDREIRWCDAFLLTDELLNKLNRNTIAKTIAVGADYRKETQTLFLSDGFQEISITESDGFFGRKVSVSLGRFFGIEQVDITNFNDTFWLNKLYFLMRGFDNDLPIYENFRSKIDNLNFKYNSKGYLIFLGKKTNYGAEILAKLSVDIDSRFSNLKQIVSEITPIDIHPFDDYTFGDRGYNQNLLSLLDFIVLEIKNVCSLIQIKNQLLVAVLTHETATIDYIKENLDRKGVLLTYYQKEELHKLDEIIQVLEDGFNILSNSISEISTQMSTLNNTLEQQLQSIDETMQVGNLISGIQTYQLYKINRNTDA